MVITFFLNKFSLRPPQKRGKWMKIFSAFHLKRGGIFTLKLPFSPQGEKKTLVICLNINQRGWSIWFVSVPRDLFIQNFWKTRLHEDLACKVAHISFFYKGLTQRSEKWQIAELWSASILAEFDKKKLIFGSPKTKQ